MSISRLHVPLSAQRCQTRLHTRVVALLWTDHSRITTKQSNQPVCPPLYLTVTEFWRTSTSRNSSRAQLCQDEDNADASQQHSLSSSPFQMHGFPRSFMHGASSPLRTSNPGNISTGSAAATGASTSQMRTSGTGQLQTRTTPQASNLKPTAAGAEEAQAKGNVRAKMGRLLSQVGHWARALGGGLLLQVRDLVTHACSAPSSAPGSTHTMPRSFWSLLPSYAHTNKFTSIKQKYMHQSMSHVRDAARPICRPAGQAVSGGLCSTCSHTFQTVTQVEKFGMSSHQYCNVPDCSAKKLHRGECWLGVQASASLKQQCRRACFCPEVDNLL